jgi:hypothetical protein
VQQPRGLVQPRHDQRVGREELDQLVADEIDDGLEVELGGHALLDAVDQRELGRVVLGAGVGGLQLGHDRGEVVRGADRRVRRRRLAASTVTRVSGWTLRCGHGPSELCAPARCRAPG